MGMEKALEGETFYAAVTDEAPTKDMFVDVDGPDPKAVDPCILILQLMARNLPYNNVTLHADSEKEGAVMWSGVTFAVTDSLKTLHDTMPLDKYLSAVIFTKDYICADVALDVPANSLCEGNSLTIANSQLFNLQ